MVFCWSSFVKQFSRGNLVFQDYLVQSVEIVFLSQNFVVDFPPDIPPLVFWYYWIVLVKLG